MTAPSGELLIVLSEALGVADRRGDNTTNMAHAQLVRLVALAGELVAHADVIVPLLQPYVTEQPKLVDLVGLGVPESQREPVCDECGRLVQPDVNRIKWEHVEPTSLQHYHAYCDDGPSLERATVNGTRYVLDDYVGLPS